MGDLKRKLKARDVLQEYLARTEHLRSGPAEHLALAVTHAHAAYREHRISLRELVVAAVEWSDLTYPIRQPRTFPE
jgi:hypothetical protein